MHFLLRTFRYLLAVEEETVSVIFPGDNSTKSYKIVWVELLSEDQVPFTSYEDVVAAEKVRASYSTPHGNINYAEAVIVQEPGKYVYLVQA